MARRGRHALRVGCWGVVGIGRAGARCAPLQGALGVRGGRGLRFGGKWGILGEMVRRCLPGKVR